MGAHTSFVMITDGRNDIFTLNPTTQEMDKRMPLPIAFFCEINRNGGYVAGSIQSIQ